jgi:hypothetical protein
MKQILQNAKTGAVAVTDVPAPVAQPGFVLVRTAASLISAGTERLTVEAAQKNLVSRAIEQPALGQERFWTRPEAMASWRLLTRSDRSSDR